MKREFSFPLVADNETVLGTEPHMALYDESDLISNIKGPYQDKEFSPVTVTVEVPDDYVLTSEVEQPKEYIPRHSVREVGQPYVPKRGRNIQFSPLYDAKPSFHSRKERLSPQLPPLSSSEKTVGQRARELAQEDIKKKRSASYLQSDLPFVTKLPKPTPSAKAMNEQKISQLSHLADKLHQETYILADMPETYSLEKEDRLEEKSAPQNSFDFLKKSQIYDYPERQVTRERQVAQELNLTHMEEEL